MEKLNNSKILKIDMMRNNGILQDVNLFVIKGKYISFPMHTHTFYDFMFIVEGSCNNVYENKTEKLVQNEVCIFKPKSIHAIEEIKNTPCTYLNFEINTEYFESLCRSFGFSSIDTLFPDDFNYALLADDETLDLLKTITIRDRVSNVMELGISQTMLKIFIAKAILKIIEKKNSLYSDSKYGNIKLKSLLELLNDPENFSLSIAEIFQKTFYTHEHITRLFQKEGLQTPAQIFLHNKLVYAAKLLLTTDLKITDIMERCGICSISYFYNAFKKEYLISPNLYRKLYSSKK